MGGFAWLEPVEGESSSISSSTERGVGRTRSTALPLTTPLSLSLCYYSGLADDGGVRCNPEAPTSHSLSPPPLRDPASSRAARIGTSQ